MENVMGIAKPSPLLSAGLLLARNGIYGMAWLDAAFIVTARFGDLTAELEVGEPLLSGMPILADYMDDIQNLPADGHSSFELPGILLVQGDGANTPRIDIHLFRSPPNGTAEGVTGIGRNEEIPVTDGNQFLLLVSRASNQTTTDVALARLQRDRSILLEQIEQQKLELERTNAELELCNRDLEDFATIISHDLKAPMRALRYFADDIESALNQSQPEDAHAACTAMKQQSRRMSTMLSQLLDYASLGRQKDALESVDTRQLIESIVSSLPRPPGFTITVHGDWPSIETYVAPLDLVLRNLIDNAIKHHDKPEEGLVHVFAEQADGHLVLTVSDNGPGIHPGRHEAVFYPFRSYRKDPNGGCEPNEQLAHGMGLAFVKRTVETVGGQLQLISNPAERRGCEFCLSWPLKTTDAAALD
jgi:signal transduction histidine kinase